jgi:hypothetical protein
MRIPANVISTDINNINNFKIFLTEYSMIFQAQLSHKQLIVLKYFFSS